MKLIVNGGTETEHSTLQVEPKDWQGLPMSQLQAESFEDANELVEFLESTLPSTTMDYLVEKLARRRGLT